MASSKLPARRLLEAESGGAEGAVLLGDQVAAGRRLDAQLGRFAQLQVETFGRVAVGAHPVTARLPVLAVVT